MMIELKPCPFCGGPVLMMQDPFIRAFICRLCGADVMFHGAEKDDKKAIKKWNRRVNDESNA